MVKYKTLPDKVFLLKELTYFQILLKGITNSMEVNEEILYQYLHSNSYSNYLELYLYFYS